MHVISITKLLYQVKQMLLGVETLAFERAAGTVLRLGPEMDEAFEGCGT